MNCIKPNSIVCCDVLDGLSRIEKNSVHLIITSCPFNVKISYDNYTDNLPHIEYLKWMKEVWSACKEVLVEGGRICINIDVTTNKEENSLIEHVHPLHVDFTNQLRELGYIYRADVIQCKHNASGKDTCWGSYNLCSDPHIRRNHEYIIVASKGNLRLDGDPMMCDLTKKEFHEWTLSEWRMMPETTKSGIHPATFTRQLPYRCIKLFSYVGNTVLDIFNGTGTSTKTAYELGRKYIGLDNSPEYCKVAQNGIREVETEFDVNGPYTFKPAPIHVKEEQVIKKELANGNLVEILE